MPLGIQQNNDFTQFTMDVWNDKIFYQEKEFPAGFMAMSILNIPEEEMPELIQAGGAPTFLFPVVVQGSDEEAAAVFPQLRERILYLTELLWKYPPFCYNDYEKEMRRINILFDERNLLQIRTPDSELQTEFLRFCVGIIRIPIAMYHFYAAGRFFELDYLRRLKKRNETHFAVAAHDCFNSEQFWDEMRGIPVTKNMYTVAGNGPCNEELALRIQAGDKNAAERLLSQNEGYLTELARAYTPWCELEDLKQEGALALLDAAGPAYGTKLLTYATPAIEAAMMDYAAQHFSSLSIPISRYNQLRRVAHLCTEGWDSSDAELVKVVCGELNVSAKVAGALIKEYRRLLLAAVCRFRVTKKRRIATALFPCSERY